jgi:hypothetical protein
MKIKFLEHEYELTRENPGMWSENGLGRSDIARGHIALKGSLPITVQHATLLHEVIHQIGDISSLKYSEPEETTISVLAAGFLSFIRQNPKVITAIINGEDVCE